MREGGGREEGKGLKKKSRGSRDGGGRAEGQGWGGRGVGTVGCLEKRCVEGRGSPGRWVQSPNHLSPRAQTPAQRGLLQLPEACEHQLLMRNGAKCQVLKCCVWEHLKQILVTWTQP